MANNLIQVKRTSVSGRVPNTSILHTGELALNMADGILYSSNGTAVFEVGANNTNATVSGNLVINKLVANGYSGSAGQVLVSNGTSAYWSTTYTESASAPLNANFGDKWFNTDTAVLLTYTYDPNGNQWVEFGAGGFIGQQGYTGSTGFTGSTGTTGYTGSTGPSSLGYNSQSTNYVVSNTDINGIISATANVIINTGVFTNGQSFSIFNNSSANLNIISNTGVTLHQAGTGSTGNRILAQYGLCAVVCVGVNTFVVSGTIY
jgi:hypothetical protein